MSAKGLAIQQMMAVTLAVISILVFSWAIIHKARIPERHVSLGECSYAECQPLSLGEIGQAMQCPDIAVVSDTDISGEELSWLSYGLYSKPDSYITLRNCDFPDMQGKPVMVVGNYTGTIRAGSTLDITRIGETVYVCVKSKCERKGIEAPTTVTTIPSTSPVERIRFDYADRSGIYLAYYAYLSPNDDAWKYVKGARIWEPWAVLQPSEDSFNCGKLESDIRNVLAAERSAGRRLYVYFDLVQGTRRYDIPQWVKEKVPFSKCTNTYGINFPIYWSDEYIDAYKKFIDRLSDCIGTLPEDYRRRIAFVRANVWAYDHENLQGHPKLGGRETKMDECTSPENIELPSTAAIPEMYKDAWRSGKIRQYMLDVTRYYKEKIYDRYGIPVTSKAFEGVVRNPVGEEIASSDRFRGSGGGMGVWFFYTNANPSVYMIRCANKFQREWVSAGDNSLLNPCPREHAEKAIRDPNICAQFYCLVRNAFTIGTSEASSMRSIDGNNVPSLVYWTILSSIHLKDAFLALYETRKPDGSFLDHDIDESLGFAYRMYENATKVFYSPEQSNISLIAFRDYFCPKAAPSPVYEFDGSGNTGVGKLEVHDYDTRVRGDYSMFMREISPELHGHYITYYSLGKDAFCRGLALSNAGIRSFGKVQFCGNDICRKKDPSRPEFEMVWAKSTRNLDGSGGKLYIDIDDAFASSVSGDVKARVYYLCEPGNDFVLIYKSSGGERRETVSPSSSSCTPGYFTWDEVYLSSPVFDNSLEEGADLIIDDSGSGNVVHMLVLDKRA